jgi:diacyltrehalose acyltransferase
VAKHRKPATRRGHRALATAATAAGLSSTLAFGHAINSTLANIDVDLAATVIGVGGRDDTTSTRLQNKLHGDYALDFPVTDYQGIDYPANLQFQSSVADGVPKLTDAVGEQGDTRFRVVSYSEGTMVAEQVKRNLAARDPETGELPYPGMDFVFIASPYVPNGGIFGRFPGFQIPGLLPEFSAAQPTGYNSTYVTNEYDGFADFPAYFNPLSIGNAVMGMVYAHPDQYYDGIDLTDPATKTYVHTVQDNGAGGQDTYILVYNPHLPLLAPVRQIASLTSLTPVTEPVLSAIEPLLRLAVDAGYTDRTNAKPETPTAFSFITPPAKIAEAVAGIPAAVEQGGADATSSGRESLQEHGVTTPDPAPTPQIENTTSVQKKKPTPDTASARITHPTVTSTGNLFHPITKIIGDALTGGLTVPTAKPVTPDSTGAQQDSPSAPAATATTGTGDTQSSAPSGDKAA